MQVRNDSCTVHEDFQIAIKECFDAYAESIEDRNSFGPVQTSELSAYEMRFFISCKGNIIMPNSSCF